MKKNAVKNNINLEGRLDPDTIKVKNLYMGEMGFGTKSSDPDAMIGLKYFLQYNGHTDITNVMMLGALTPRIPEYYSVSGSEDMRFLAQDPSKPSNRKVILRLKKANVKKSDLEYFKKYVDKKITTRQDAVNVARERISKLAGILKKAEWHYQHGEEDRENIKVAKEMMIADAAKKKTDFKQYQEKIQKLEGGLKKLQGEKERITQKKQFMGYVSGRLKDTKEKQGQELRQYLQDLVQAKLPEYKIDEQTKLEIMKLVSLKSLTTERVLEETERLKVKVSELRTEEDDMESQAKEYQHKIDGVKRQMEFWDAFRFTKRHKVEADEEEEFFRLSKSEYNDLLYKIFPDFLKAKDRVHIHSSGFNELTDPLHNSEIEKDPEVGEKDEYAVVKGEGLVYYLAHNPNMLNSNTPTAKDLAMLKEEVKRLEKLADILGAPVPDVTLSSHGAYGLRYQPQLKFRETIIEGQNRLEPEIVWHIKLPTMQSIPNLEQLKRRGLKNFHTKRYAKGSFASGIFLHTAYENKKVVFEYLDESTLRRFGKIGKQIEAKKRKLKKTEDGKEQVRLKRQISKLEKKIVITAQSANVEEKAVVKIESDGDTHLGSANESGRRTNYEIADAVQRFQREYGLPDIVVVSEVIHKEMRICPTDKQYMGLNPKKFEDRLKEIRAGSHSLEEKLDRMEQVAVEDKHSTPITHNAVTYTEWKDRCLPYIIEVLEKGGRAIFVSGNHPNSDKDSDEATTLANMVPAKYEDQVEVFHAKGDRIGCGETILPGGKKMYATHKMKTGQDELIGATKQALKQGINADLILLFDRHHGGGAYADNSAYTLAPGRQSWNRYVDQIGKLSSPGGVVNTFLSTDEEVKYVKWEWALGDCLEPHFMPPRIEDQTLHKRKSFIPAKPKRKKLKK